MLTILITLLLQLGAISSAADFDAAQFDETSSTYQGESIIIKDEIVY